MTFKKILLTTALAAAPVLLAGQGQGGLDPASMLKPLADAWPTYSGDYTGRRFSTLTQINQTNVKHLTLAWVARLTAGAGGAAGGGFGGGRGGGFGGGAPVIVGGEGTGDFAGGGTASIKGAILQVDGVLYMSAPDNAWAVDARDGRELWHYYWKTKGGTHIGSRGMGMWNNYLYFETPDNYLVSLDAKTGKERWHVEISDFNQQYFSTMAPIVIGNHVLAGTGNDLDAPGFLQSFDPETGKLQWKFYTVPMNPGDPGLDTWPSLEAARHGGGQVWIPGVYDAETKLYIFGTGNPTPGYTGVARKGDNLFTCSLVAVDVETGKMAWYLPDVAARHARLGLRADAGAHRRRDQRPSEEDGLDRRTQRLLLHRGPGDGREHREQQVRHDDELVHGAAQEWRSGAEPGEGGDDSRVPGFAG